MNEEPNSSNPLDPSLRDKRESLLKDAFKIRVLIQKFNHFISAALGLAYWQLFIAKEPLHLLVIISASCLLLYFICFNWKYKRYIGHLESLACEPGTSAEKDIEKDIEAFYYKVLHSEDCKKGKGGIRPNHTIRETKIPWYRWLSRCEMFFFYCAILFFIVYILWKLIL
ncbi:hypothetical protein DID77_01560 [Candidatus Marinamargulisbacteria bacterium SCGC AG-439-L15]|nr:hypothetical protein DID77_01560 [Candidatus Marinamargulisbacteria bacterium SCGC AG-439-L15]